MAGLHCLAPVRGLMTAAAVQAHRDIHTFTRRAGRLPEQREGDAADFRSLLHRDGSVLSTLTLQARTPLVLQALYAQLLD